jgi:hypothetical protein
MNDKQHFKNAIYSWVRLLANRTLYFSRLLEFLRSNNPEKYHFGKNRGHFNTLQYK